MDACVSLVSMHGLFCQQKKFTPFCYQQLKLAHSITKESNGYEASHEPGTQPKRHDKLLFRINNYFFEKYFNLILKMFRNQNWNTIQ